MMARNYYKTSIHNFIIPQHTLSYILDTFYQRLKKCFIWYPCKSTHTFLSRTHFKPNKTNKQKWCRVFEYGIYFYVLFTYMILDRRYFTPSRWTIKEHIVRVRCPFMSIRGVARYQMIAENVRKKLKKERMKIIIA